MASRAAGLVRHLSSASLQSERLLLNSRVSTTFLNYEQRRHLNLQEYASKKLMKDYGVHIQKFEVADTAEQAVDIGRRFKAENADDLVVKAQILAGGRGKGTFDNGFKGGVHLTKDPESIHDMAVNMLGNKLSTKQTPPGGVVVKKLMVCEGLNISRETYLAIMMDRAFKGPVIVASPEGGVDIEEVAEQRPEKFLTEKIDIIEGITEEQSDKIAAFLEFKGDRHRQAAAEIRKLYQMFVGVDATQVEINPFGETDTGDVVCFDAKINFDNNAKFRQEHVFAMDDLTETDSCEIEAAKYNLNYIPLDGNIACMVNGAGLAMATMDIIKLNGGNPANFLDLGGGVTEDGVYHGFRLLTSDSEVYFLPEFRRRGLKIEPFSYGTTQIIDAQYVVDICLHGKICDVLQGKGTSQDVDVKNQVKSVLVNIFGGIVNCATIARGITKAYEGMKLKIPIVVRLEGTNVEEAKRILTESNMPIETADNLDDAASKAVASLA